MTIAREYTFLGKTPEGYSRWNCKFTAAADDGYVQGTGLAFTFTGLARVLGIEGITPFGSIWNNVGNVIAPAYTEGGGGSCIQGNVVTLMVLQSAGSAAELAEKITENFGYVTEFWLTVFGL